MIPANVQVQIDEKAIKEYIEKQLDQQIHETLLMIDLEKLAIITSMSKRFWKMKFYRTHVCELSKEENHENDGGSTNSHWK